MAAPVDTVRRAETEVAPTQQASQAVPGTRYGLVRRYSAALLTLGAAAIHFAVAAGHMAVYTMGSRSGNVPE